MQPNQSGIHQQLVAEAQRRGLGAGNSNVGLRQNPSASQPINQGSQNPLAMRQGVGGQKPTMPTSNNPFGGAAQAMNGSMPLQGGTALEKALVKRMNMYPPA